MGNTNRTPVNDPLPLEKNTVKHDQKFSYRGGKVSGRNASPESIKKGGVVVIIILQNKHGNVAKYTRSNLFIDINTLRNEEIEKKKKTI